MRRLATTNLDRILLTWDLIVEELSDGLPAICVLGRFESFADRRLKTKTTRCSCIELF